MVHMWQTIFVVSYKYSGKQSFVRIIESVENNTIKQETVWLNLFPDIIKNKGKWFGRILLIHK